ncbi:hypothetical protein J2J97_31895 (plasmid) [Rhizobium bangladeshense]|uniref:hypothetical protein n=1 Tax=Rhizobium bangladeshense TaxID=1138189 RepID=UPI001A983ABE|nr:hypothetical protein [Rhizobium bangladeshense]QSY98675.1 hypothetical protein J2J97_31895 [Rhizobium bangladeshense]
MKQVISIGADGQISGLQRKPGQGVDLRQFGQAEIKRVSEIEFNEPTQKWFVHVLRGPWAGIKVARGHFMDHLGAIPDGGAVNEDTLIVEFEDYDMAVKAEIAILDALRLKGQY